MYRFAKKRNSFIPLTDFGRCSIFDTSCLIYFQKNYNSVHQNSKWQTSQVSLRGIHLVHTQDIPKN